MAKAKKLTLTGAKREITRLEEELEEANSAKNLLVVAENDIENLHERIDISNTKMNVLQALVESRLVMIRPAKESTNHPFICQASNGQVSPKIQNPPSEEEKFLNHLVSELNTIADRF